MRAVLLGFLLCFSSYVQALGWADTKGRTDLPLQEDGSPKGKLTTDRDGYWYLSGGLAFMAPKITVGYRFQRGCFGSDLSFTEAVLPPQVFSQGLQWNQLCYPHPNLEGQSYFGISEGVHLIILAGKELRGVEFDLSIGAVAGHQFRTKRHRHFLEGKLGVPLRASFCGIMYHHAKYPFLVPSVSYGISF